MIGIDSVGRLAVGQISVPATIATLIASVGSYSVTGSSALFKPSILAGAGSYIVSGSNSQVLQVGTSGAGVFVVTCTPATLTYNLLWTEKTKETEIWTEKVYGA